MQLIPAKLPLFINKIFPKYVWNLPTEEQVMYLTFDDGPTPVITPWVLDILDKYNAKATFFCIGNNIEKHPEIFQETLKRGHATGNHTYNHLKGWQANTTNYLEEIKQTQDVIDREVEKFLISNQQSPISNLQSKISDLFRPPFGQITNKQGAKLIALGYNIIMWSVLAVDWSPNTSKEKALKNVINNAKNGSVVVFHDSVKASKNMQYALPQMLDYFSKKGFRFKALTSEVLKAKQTLE